MLEHVKLALRIKNNAFDIEINELIEAAKLNLKYSGVAIVNECDPLIKQAITVYCKANFGLDNKDSEKYQKAYDILVQHIALVGDYNVE